MKRNQKQVKERGFKPRNFKGLFFFFALLFILSIALAYYFLWRRPAMFFPSRLFGTLNPNVILVTVDTLRADRLHCYGFEGIETPAIDLFSARGVRFAHCVAQTPLTLPSHTTILTGTLPLFHGVRDNGGFVVPKNLVTLAEVFAQAGYATAAFVSAYVLDSRWGLDQGFDYYFDQFDLSKFEKISLSMVQRPANEVIDQVLSWLQTNYQKSFFLWVHLYDPHTPYSPPETWAKKYLEHPYLAEIAFTDHELRRLWDFLDNRGVLSRSLFVFTADHGESLGEHGEATHGFFLYEGAIHVPLIFVLPQERFQGIQVSETVSLTDIMPTILEVAGLPLPPQVQGKSLRPYFFNPRRSERRLVYSETFYPRFHFGWSQLVSVQNGRWKLIMAPQASQPELFDLRADSKEKNNLAGQETRVLKELEKEAAAYIDHHSRNAIEVDFTQIDEETRERLAALGYVGSFIDIKATAGKKLAHPRDKIDVFNALSRARETGMEGNADEAIAIIERIISQDPEISDAYFTLGNIYFRLGRFADAARNFRQSLSLKPDDTFAALNIANCYLRLGKPDEAEAFLLEFIRKGFPDSQVYFFLGNIKFWEQKYEEAIKYYQECLSLNADSASAYNALGAVYIVQENLDKAEEFISRALELNPELTNAHYNLAQVYELKGMTEKAIEAYHQELSHSPRHFKASFNLARLHRLAGNDREEERWLRLCLAAEPSFPLTYFYLARIMLNRGEKYEEAVSLVHQGIKLRPEPKDLAFGFFLLADLYNRLGKLALSEEYARKGEELSRSLGNR